MAITYVDFWMRAQVEDHTFLPGDAVISLTDPGQAPAVIGGCVEVLRLEFLDLEGAVDHPNFRPTSLFQTMQAERICDFVKRLHADPLQRRMVVHCEGGASRSAAVALFVEKLTACDFPTKAFACYANKRVVSMLSTVGNVYLDIPKTPEKPEAGRPFFQTGSSGQGQSGHHPIPVNS